jgi:peroxiredoxin Q/BCP
MTTQRLIFALAASLMSFLSLANANQWEGQSVPEFSLSNQHGQVITNKDLLGKWTVLYFYPKDKTPGCTIEAQKFTDDYEKYQSRNVQIIGVSYDDVESHKDFAETYDMPFMLLADTEKKLGKAMKVHRILPLPHTARETFLVNPKGIIVKHYKKVSPKNHSEQLLKDLALLLGN